MMLTIERSDETEFVLIDEEKAFIVTVDATPETRDSIWTSQANMTLAQAALVALVALEVIQVTEPLAAGDREPASNMDHHAFIHVQEYIKRMLNYKPS